MLSTYKQVRKFIAVLASIILIPILGIPSAHAVGAAFTCNSVFYQSSTTAFNSYDPVTNRFTQIVGSGWTVLNGIGWNTDDNYIYGVSGTKLYKVDATGAETDWGVPSGTALAGGAADYWSNQHALLVSSTSGNNWVKVTIGATTGTSTATAFTLTGSTFSGFDFTIVGDTAYGLNNTTLSIVNLTTKVVTTKTVGATAGAGYTAPTNDSYGAAYSDKDGNLYFYGNSSANVYQIPATQIGLASPSSKLMGGGPAYVGATGTTKLTSPNDGANCQTAASAYVPTVTTSAATSITTTTGTINGAVTPNGAVITSASFCYGTAADLTGCNTSSIPSGTYSVWTAGSSANSVSAALTGLSPGTKYYFKLTATNSAGSNTSTPILNFTTTALPNHTVTFSSNGGSGSMSNQVTNASTALTSNTFTRAGYSFTGWNTLSGGTGTPYADGATYDFSADLTLYAQWSASSHAVTYNSQGGSSVSSGSFVTGGTVTLPSAPTKSGYTFSGWFTATSGGTALTSPYSPGGTSDITLYAQWSADSHSITYDTQGGSTVTSGSFVTGGSVTLPSAPTKSGYTFNGWFTATGGGTALTSPYSPSGILNLTLYAQWTALPLHTVTFNYNYGPDPRPTTTQTSNVPTSLTSLSFTAPVLDADLDTDMNFVGWRTNADGTGDYYPDGGTYSFSSDVTLYAVWSPVATYTVTFDSNGGSGSMNVVTDDDLEALPVNTFTRSGYTFSGWSKTAFGSADYLDGGNYNFAVDQTRTLYAVWAAIPNHTVSFNNNGGSGSISDQTTNVPTVVSGNSFTKAGYRFTGWNTNSGGTGTPYADGATYDFSSDITLYAQWSANSYVVTFDSQGGTTASAGSYSTGGSVTLPDGITKNGYDFLGWYTTTSDGTALTSPYSPGGTGDLTLYAQWSPKTYTVHFDSQGGSSVSDSSYSTGGSLSMPDAPTKSGYTFTGWFLASSGGSALVNPYSPSGIGDETFYAQWSILNHTVTFDSNGGLGSMASQSYNLTENLNTGSFTNSGFAFQGWNTQADGLGTPYIDGASYDFASGDITLYAQWAGLVIFNANGGQGEMSDQTSLTSADLHLNTFTKDGYSFGGWVLTLGGTEAFYNDGGLYPFNLHGETLYALWIANAFTVTFDINGGIGSISPQTANTPTALSTGPISRDGYAFSGWATSTEGPVVYLDSALYQFDKDVTLFAVWAVANHTVTFNGNGSDVDSPTMSDQVSNLPTNLDLNQFVKSGYNFDGWSTSAESNVVDYTDGQSYDFSTNTTLYAVWSFINTNPCEPYPSCESGGGSTTTYTVTFMPNTGTGTMDPQSGNGTGNLNPNTFTKSGFSFNGWTTNADGTGDLFGDTSSFVFGVDITLYARWAVNNHTITFDSNYGTGTMDSQTYNLSEAISTNVFTKSNFVFAGWNTQMNGLGVSYADGAIYDFTAGSITLYAQWVGQVIFNSNGGTGTMANQTGNDNSALSANTFTRDGYYFAGWVFDPADKIAFFYDKDIYPFSSYSSTLYALWVKSNVTVTFDSNDGAGSMGDQSNSVLTPLSSNQFTRAGFAFDGWATSAEGAVAYTDGANYDFGVAGTTLYAHWIPQVVFNSNGGTGTMAPQTSYVNTTLNSNTFAKDGYTFAGWATSPTGTADYADGGTYRFYTLGGTTLYATWTENPPASHTVTFYANGGTGTMDPQTASGSGNLNPNTFTYPGYSFNGWTTNADGSGDVFGDLSSFNFGVDFNLYARWEVRNHTVTFDPTSGTGTMDSQTYNLSEGLSTNTFTRDGFAFIGWNTQRYGGGTNYVDGATYDFTSGDIVMYAQWAGVVIFNANGGEGTMANQSAPGNANLTENAFTRAGYYFNGWAFTADATSPIYYNQDLYPFSSFGSTLYAVWVRNDSVVTFESNGGTGTMGNQSSNAVAPLYGNLFSRDGYTFQGWATTPTGTVAYLDGANFDFSEGGGTLYVIWSQNPAPDYTITFKNNGGVGTMADQTFNGVEAIATNTFTRAGYIFNGWFAADGHATVYADGANYDFSNGDVIFYAQWVPEVVFDSNGGTGTMSPQDSQINAVLNANSFTRTGYTFNGWNTEAAGSGTSYADEETYPFAIYGGTTLYAQWEIYTPVTYTITFLPGDATSGDVPTTVTGVTSGTIFTIPGGGTLVKTGHTFAGWCIETCLFQGDTIEITADLSLTAIFNNTVTFNANGGGGEMAPQVDWFQNNLDSNTFTRPGYTFAGWSTTSGGTSEYADGGLFTFLAGDTTLYAVWTALPTHTLTFHANGGSGEMTPQVIYEATALTTNAFTRSGYTFAGWSLNAEGTGSSYADSGVYGFESDTDLYAMWTLIPLDSFTVTFHNNGGTGSMSNQVASSATALTANAFSRIGYTFGGWSTTAEGLLAYEDGAIYPFTSSTTLYAMWNPKTITITYNSEGGSVVDNGSYSVGGYTTSAVAPTYAGHTFMGWFLAPTGGDLYISANIGPWLFPQTSDFTLYAQWTLIPPTEYTVTFNGNGGSGSMTDEASASEATLTSNGFTNSGYTFGGWSLTAGGELAYANGASYPFTSSTTLYAIWTLNPPDTFTVTFDSNGGTGSMSNQVASSATALSSNGFTKSGYTFGGWSLTAGGELAYANGASYPFTSSTTLHAIWTMDYIPPVVYAVIYLSGGATGTAPGVGVYVAGTVFGIPAPSGLSKTGNRFAGWSDGHSTRAAGANFMVPNGNVTFTATWALITYSCAISYSANGGTGSMPAQSCNDLSVTLQANGFSRAGYTFAGWNTQSNGSGTNYSNSQVLQLSNDLNLNLFALWTANTYQVVYNGNGSDGGSSPAGQNYSTGAVALQVAANTFTTTGYTFTSWNTSSDGSGTKYAVGDSLTLASNLTLYAQWKKVEVTPTPTPTPTGTPSPTPSPTSDVKGEVKTTGGVKKVIPNQIVPINQLLQLQVPAGTKKVEVFVNRVLVQATISASGQIKLPMIVGPNDKITLVVTDANGVITTSTVTLIQDPISLANINFDTGSWKLLPAATKVLESVVASIIRHGFKNVLLVGYTDAAGAGTFDNQGLSNLRSAEVAKYLSRALAKYGVKISTTGKAEKNPVASNLNADGMFLNRRVEIVVS